MRSIALVGLALAAAALSGCGAAVCDRNAKLDVAAKNGDCGFSSAKLLGERASCEAGIKSCSDADQKTLQTMFDCVEKLQACTSATKDAYVAASGSCFGPLSGLSDACKTALFT